MKKVFRLFLLIFPILTSAEEVPHPELRNLYEADLIVDATFKNQTASHFYIIVNESIIDRGFGIKKGDQIKLDREDNGCGSIVDFSYYNRQRFYLKKYAQKWVLNYGSTQSIQPHDKFGNTKSSELKGETTINNIIKEFEATYYWDTIKHDYLTRKTDKEIRKLSKVNPVIAYFESIGRIGLPGYEPMAYAEKPKDEIEVEKSNKIALCDQYPIIAEPLLDKVKMREFLTQNENPLSNQGIAGKVVLELFISDLGNVESVKVIKGVHPELEKIAIEKAKRLSNWTPAKTESLKPKSCITRLPFTFKIDSQ